jgi:hypothetical protein
MIQEFFNRLHDTVCDPELNINESLLQEAKPLIIPPANTTEEIWSQIKAKILGGGLDELNNQPEKTPQPPKKESKSLAKPQNKSSVV